MTKQKSVLLHFAIMMVLYFVIGSLTPFGGITELGMKVLGAFVAIVYGWVALDLFLTSVFGFVLLGLSGAFTPTSAFAAGLANSNVQLIIVVGVFAAALEQLGVGELIVNFMLSRKIVVGRPWILVIAFVLIGSLFGIAGKSLLGVIILLNIVVAFARKCGIEGNHPALTFLAFMIVVCASYLPAGFAPYMPTLIMFGGLYTNGIGGFALPFGKLYVFGIVLSAILIVIMLLFAKYVMRIDVSKFVLTEEERQKYAAYKATPIAKVALAGLGVYVCLLLSPLFISKEIPIIAFIENVGLIGWSLVYVTVFCLWIKEDGKPAVDLAQSFMKVPWQIVALLAVTIPLGNALARADVGVMAAMTTMLKPIMSDLGLTGFYIFVFLFLGILTQFAHNFVAGAVFLPLFGNIGLSMGADPTVLFVVMFCALNTAFATPAASMTAAFIFAADGVVQKHAYIWGWLLLVVVGILVLLGIPVMNMFF